MNLFNTRLETVQKTLGEFSEIGRSMQELQTFLQSPKLRGNLGEQVLKDLLAQHFPPDAYVTQHRFKNGATVDVAIKTSQGYIAIDAKFPLENFKKIYEAVIPEEKEKMRKAFSRDVKKHIEDIASKYILTSEGTVDYALMYIPSETVYYEILSDREISDFCHKTRVLPVSPLSFYAYMKSILISFEGQRIQSKAREIMVILKSIQKEYEKGEDAVSLLGKHLTNAFNQLHEVNHLFSSLGQKIHSTSTLSSPQTPEKLIE